MLSPPRAASHRPPEYPLQRLQFSNRNDAQTLADRDENRGSTDHFHRSLSGKLKNVRSNRLGSDLDGLAIVGAKWISPLAGKTAFLKGCSSHECLRQTTLGTLVRFGLGQWRPCSSRASLCVLQPGQGKNSRPVVSGNK